MSTRRAIGIARLLAATVGIVALISRFSYGLGFRSFFAVNFFGYLTMQSNIAAVAVAITAGVTALRGRPEGRLLTAARGAVTCFVLVAGIVFALLVTQGPAQGYRIEVPWSDQVLHFWLPALSLIDWILSPGRGRLSWRVMPVVIGYPTVWGIVTSIRGRAVGWYPYFFLDPAQSGYPGIFFAYSAGALALFAAVAVGLILVSRRRPLLETAVDRVGGSAEGLSRRTAQGRSARPPAAPRPPAPTSRRRTRHPPPR